jgi:hypothetical protein
MVYAVKKFPDIAFQCETRTGKIPAFFPDHYFDSQYAFVRSFAHPAGKGIGDKSFVIKRIENSENRMMQNTVSHGCFVNMANLRIVNVKSGIWRMNIPFAL